MILDFNNLKNEALCFQKLRLDNFISGNEDIEKLESIHIKLFKDNISLNNFKQLIIDKLMINNYIIIKNFGVDVKKFIILNLLLAKKIYFSNRMNCYLHNFICKINSEELSEELESGGFHTDFLFQNNIPDFISLNCINKDPKYPYLGRNYIIDVNKIFKILVTNFNLTEDYLFNISFPYTFGDKTIWIRPFKKIDNKLEMTIHLKIIDKLKLTKEHLINGIFLNDIINHISLSEGENLVLDSGDVIIMSNKFLLHKRGECSIDLINEKSREINSIRFYL